MSRQLQTGDAALITYGNTVFNTIIQNINGLTLSVHDSKNNITTSVTWNGAQWLLPGNIPATNVQFVLKEKAVAAIANVPITQTSAAMTTTVVNTPLTSTVSTVTTSSVPNAISLTKEKKIEEFILPSFPLIKAQIVIPTTKFIPQQEIEIAFPWKRSFMSEQEIRQMFSNLSNYNFHVVSMPYDIKRMLKVDKKLLAFGGQQLVLNTPIENYNVYDNISDYFTEKARMNCKRSDQTQNPLQYWNTHQKEIEAKLGTKEKSLKNLRDATYELHYECTSFKPSLFVGFLKYFGSKRILDCMSGWGDRLIGAMAMDKQIEYYVGVDSNAALFKGYEEMISFFGMDKKKYIMIEGEFEKVQLPNLTYDMIFTSPPFYDLEEYSDKNQSYIGRDLETWYKDFLLGSLKKAWNVLEKNGFMIIYINDTYNAAYTERMINDVIKFVDSQYVGCLPASDVVSKKNMNPFWIFKRL